MTSFVLLKKKIMKLLLCLDRDNLCLCPQAMVTHTWLQNKPFVFPLEVRVVLLCLES